MNNISERVVVVRNPVSSRAGEVQLAVDRLNDVLPMHRLHEVWTPSPDTEETIGALQEIIRPGDRIIVAAGDGTGNAVVNACLRAKADSAAVGFLPYGNFNDMAATFTGRSAGKDPARLLTQARLAQVHPLEVSVDDEHHRYAVLYATLGWTTTVAEMFNGTDKRRDISRSGAGVLRSIMDVVPLYFRTRSDSYLPEFRRGGEPCERVSDVLAFNGPIAAGVIRSHHPYYEENTFLSTDIDVSSLRKNMPLLGRSALNLLLGTRFTLPGQIKTNDTLVFDEARVPMQLDGEFVRFGRVSSIRIAKDQSADPTVVQVMKTTR